MSEIKGSLKHQAQVIKRIVRHISFQHRICAACLRRYEIKGESNRCTSFKAVIPVIEIHGEICRVVQKAPEFTVKVRFKAYPQRIRWRYSLNTPLDKAKKLSLRSATYAEYANSADLIGESTTGAFSASRSSVRTLTLREELNLDYKIGKSQIGLKGTYAWRRINGDAESFQSFDATDFSYGANAIINMPWNMQLSTDLMMYSRRGYTGSSMNTNDLVWNARLSYTVMKGRLTFMLDAFDILNQINNVTRVVNAQGRTETFTNALPRYALLHVAYKFNIMPKKK